MTRLKANRLAQLARRHGGSAIVIDVSYVVILSPRGQARIIRRTVALATTQNWIRSWKGDSR